MEKNYLARSIDVALLEWKESPLRKPLLVRGARQVGKSSSVRHLGETFKYFLEVNLLTHPELTNNKPVFAQLWSSYHILSLS